MSVIVCSYADPWVQEHHVLNEHVLWVLLKPFSSLLQLQQNLIFNFKIYPEIVDGPVTVLFCKGLLPLHS